MSLVSALLTLPRHVQYDGTIGNATLATIDADGEKAAFILRAPKSGEIKYVHWRTATVNTGGDILVSIETVSDTNGDPTGTDKDASCASVTVTVAAADDNKWFRTDMTVGGTQSCCTVTKGDIIAVIWERASGTFEGNIGITRTAMMGGIINFLYLDTYTGGAWAKAGVSSPTLALEYDDGSCPVIYGVVPADGVGSAAVGSGSTPDTYAAKITPTFDCRVTGAWVYVDLDAGVTVSLTDSAGNVLGSCTMELDKDVRGNTAARTGVYLFPSTYTLAAGTTYYLCLMPSEVAAAGLYWLTVDTALAGDNRLMDAWDDGLSDNIIMSTCKDFGGWTDYTGRRLAAGLLIDQIDDGAGSGGGLITHPGMVGGMRG